jgi:hypothetical protein
MTKQFENLTLLLNNNPRLRDAFFEQYRGKTEYLSNLENIISFFSHTHGEMIIEKIRETSTLRKFDSLISELTTARIFAQKGCEVHLLPDDYFKTASPDILCQCHNFSFYVEVTQFSDSEPTLKIIEDLRGLLRKNSFNVQIEFTDKLSPPCFSGEERQEQEKILEKSMEQFKKELELLTPKVTSHEIITAGIKFSLKHSDGKPGIPCSFMSSYKFPKELFEKYVTYRLLEKAKKRVAFEGSERNCPYIVTFVSENISIDDIDFKDLLYGQRPTLLVFPFDDPEITRLATIQREKEWIEILDNKVTHIPKWQEIEAAANNGWHDFLTEIHYIPHDYTYLAKEGLFLSEPLMKNVSGIQLIRKSSESYFYPNPFSDQEISMSNFQDFFN